MRAVQSAVLEGARAQGAAIMTRTWRIGPDALEVISMPIAAGQKRRQWLHQTRRRGRHKHLPNLIGPTSTQASKGHGWCRLPLFRTPPRERFVALLRRQIMPRESSDRVSLTEPTLGLSGASERAQGRARDAAGVRAHSHTYAWQPHSAPAYRAFFAR